MPLCTALVCVMLHQGAVSTSTLLPYSIRPALTEQPCQGPCAGGNGAHQILGSPVCALQGRHRAAAGSRRRRAIGSAHKPRCVLRITCRMLGRAGDASWTAHAAIPPARHAPPTPAGPHRARLFWQALPAACQHLSKAKAGALHGAAPRAPPARPIRHTMLASTFTGSKLASSGFLAGQQLQQRAGVRQVRALRLRWALPPTAQGATNDWQQAPPRGVVAGWSPPPAAAPCSLLLALPSLCPAAAACCPSCPRPPCH